MKTLIADCREMVLEQFEYRELLLQMTRRDIALRYKQTIMGFGWALFMPLLNTAVFSVIFTRVAPIETPVAYPVFAFCGLWVWNFFASALRFSVTSLTSNSTMVTKVYFPREIFPISAVLVCLLDFLVGASALIALMVWYRIPPTVHLLWLPAVVCVHLTLTAAVALLLSMANLFFRDVKYLFEVVVTLWMFATPVIYSFDAVQGTLGTVLRLNPMTPIVDAYRSVLLLGRPPAADLLGVAVLVAALMLTAWYVFHRCEYEFAERI